MYFPTQDAFLKLATQGNLIPVTRRLLADLETPLSAYRKIRGQGESFLFESVEGGEHLGRYSFVGCNPRAVIRQIDDGVRAGRKEFRGAWHVRGHRDRLLILHLGDKVKERIRSGCEVVRHSLRDH